MLDFINMTYHQIAQLLSIGEEQTPGQVRSLEDNETVNPKTLRRPFVCLHRDALLLLSPPSQIPSDPILSLHQLWLYCFYCCYYQYCNCYD